MNKYKNIYMFIVMFIVCSLSIGFSAFESNVAVEDIAATVRVQENIRITAFNYYDATSLAIASSSEYAEELLISDISLPNADSTITYQVTVTNYGNTEMGIYEFNGLPENLTYEVSGYTMQDKICDSSANCSLGAIITFSLTIKYKENGYNSANTNYSLNVGVDFRGFHTVTYKNITDNGFPAYIIDGGTLSINITDELEVISKPTIYANNVAINQSEYSYVDGLLVYKNITSDVEVNGAYLTGLTTGVLGTLNLNIGQIYVPAIGPSAKYSDGSSKNVMSFIVEPNRPLTKDDTVIKESYTENGITKQVEFSINVSYMISLSKNSKSGGTCAIEYNGVRYTSSETLHLSPGSKIKFISDNVYINGELIDMGDAEYYVNSPMTIVLGFASSAEEPTSIYAFTSKDFVNVPPKVQVVNSEFNEGGTLFVDSYMQLTHVYSDGTLEVVSDYNVVPDIMPAEEGLTTINISYERENQTYSTDLPIYVSTSSGCFVEGTLVTMADGTKKPIEDVTYDDELIAWDFNTGRYAITKPSLIETDAAKKHRVLNLEFEDGTVVGVIDHHGFFDKKVNDFVFIDEANVASYIGHEFIKMSDSGSYKTVKLKSFSIKEKVTRFYTIQTAVYNNCIAEDMFTLTPPPDGYKGWFNFFEIGKNMKYDEFKKRNDIVKYGLYSYDEFSEYVTYEQFMAFNGPYLKVLVGKGLLTKEQILNAISFYLR